MTMSLVSAPENSTISSIPEHPQRDASDIVEARRSRRGGCAFYIKYLALMLAGIGLLASISSTITCNYFAVPELSDPTLGIWWVTRNLTNADEAFLNCESYPSGVDLDAYFLTARVVSILSPITCLVGGWFSFLLQARPTHSDSGPRLMLAVGFMFLASIFQALTLMVLESSVCLENSILGRSNPPSSAQCQRQYGANMSIGAASVMATALFCLLITGRRI